MASEIMAAVIIREAPQMSATMTDVFFIKFIPA
jgi:hypothetical protein